MTVAQVRKAVSDPPRMVVVSDGELDRPLGQYRAGLAGEFLPADPRELVEVASVADLQARRAELLGRHVRLTEKVTIENYFFEVKKSRETEETFNTATAIYAPLAVTGDRTWIVSERMKSKDDPRVKEFVARATHTGVLRSLWDVNDASLLWAGYQRVVGREAPREALALDTEEPVAASAPVQLFVPVKSSGAEVWVATCGTEPTRAAGFLRRVRNPTLDEMAERVVHHQGVSHKERVVLWQVDKKRFAKLLDRHDPCR